MLWEEKDGSLGRPWGLVFQKEVCSLSEQTGAQTKLGPHLAQDCLALQISSPLFKPKLHVRTSEDGRGAGLSLEHFVRFSNLVTWKKSFSAFTIYLCFIQLVKGGWPCLACEGSESTGSD